MAAMRAKATTVSGNSTVAAAARTEAGPRRAGWLGFCAFAATIALLAAQALVARRLELTFDEAYYTLWSRALSFGYLDHPPMVALLIRASTALFGGSEIGVRALSLLVVGAMPALIALIAWRLFGSAEKAALAALMWIAMPLVVDRRGVRHPRRAAGRVLDPWACGSRRALAHRPDALADRARAGAWPGAAIEVHRRLFRRRGRPRPGRDAVAAPLARLAGALCRPRRRAGDIRPVRRLERRARLGDLRQAARPRAAARICALLYRRIPCFADRPHQSARLRRARPRASRPSPGARPSAARSRDEARRVLVCTIAPAAVYFLLHSIHDRVQGNWLAPLYPAAAILAADWVAEVRRAGASGLAARSQKRRCGRRRSGSPSRR